VVFVHDLFTHAFVLSSYDRVILSGDMKICAYTMQINKKVRIIDYNY